MDTTTVIVSELLETWKYEYVTKPERKIILYISQHEIEFELRIDDYVVNAVKCLVVRRLLLLWNPQVL